jgi:hypothetical protein
VTDDASARDRLRWLGRTASMWMLAILLLVVAVLVGVTWTLGLFTSSAPNPKNTVSAGSMSQDNSADDSAIMGAGDLLPGDSVEGSATIENVGDARGDFTLRVKDIEDEPGPNGGALSSWLALKVFEGTEVIWSGPLGKLQANLGTWSPGESHTYTFEITFPSAGTSVDDAYQGSRVTATFEWHAVQAH